MRRFHPGDAIVLRELWWGQIFHARPAILVQDEPAQTMVFVPGGVRCAVPVDDDGRELRLPDRPWRLEARERGIDGILSFAWPGTPHAVLRWSVEPAVWYVNLQDPLERTAIGFDTTDHALDAIVEPDGSWRWKDEDEIEEAVERGLFTAEEAAAFRAEGERAVARILRREPPFDRDWAPWRADPAWPTPTLPDGWDRL